jgi:hypothetical protein
VGAANAPAALRSRAMPVGVWGGKMEIKILERDMGRGNENIWPFMPENPQG